MLKVIRTSDIPELKEKRDFSKNWNEAARKAIIKEIENWDSVRDNFKFQFFHSLLVNSYYTKSLLDAINKDYEDNTDTAFKYHKDNGLI